MKILSFGEIIWDIYGEKRDIGGAPFNFAAHASLCKDEVYLLSAVGEDDLGIRAICEAQSLGINTDYVYVNPEKQTGTCTVSLDEKGIPTFDLAADTAYDSLRVNPDIVKEGFDLIAYGTLALRTDTNKKLLSDLIASGVSEKAFLDLNLREPFYTLETVEFAIERADILKMNDSELKYVEDKITHTVGADIDITLNELSRKYSQLELIIVTFGEFGSYAFSCRTRELFTCPAKRIKAVSTVGAGDCFGAVFVSAYHRGKNISECLVESSDKSAQVVASEQAVPDKMRIRSAFLEITEELKGEYINAGSVVSAYLGGVFSRLDGGVWTPYLMKVSDDKVFIADLENEPILVFYISKIEAAEFKMENGNLWFGIKLEGETLSLGLSKTEWLSEGGMAFLDSIERQKEILGRKHFEKCTGRFSWLYRIIHL